MKNKLVLALAVVLLAPTVYVKGQNHLEPTTFDHAPTSTTADFYDDERELYEGLSTRPLARYTATSSYFPSHEVLSIEKDADGNCKMIFHRMDRGDLFAREVAVPGEFADLIGKLFQTVIGQARRPAEDRLGFDGTDFYFTTTQPDGKLATGTIWSPDSGTPTGKLVEICADLTSLTIDGDTDFRDATFAIQKFLDELNKPGQDGK